MKVEVLIPCMADQFSPQTGKSLLRVLQHLGVEAHYPPQQTCCGLPAYNAGYWKEAKTLGEKFINEFNTDKYIVMTSVSCVNMIRNKYNLFFYNTSLHLEYKKIQTRVFEISDFLINILHLSAWKGKFKAKVMLHSVEGDYNITKEATQLLQMIQELTLVENKDHDSCGIGTIFTTMYPQLSTNMAIDVLNKAISLNVEYIVTVDTSCQLHLEKVALKNKLPIKIISLIDLLAESLKYSDAVFNNEELIALG